MQNELIINDIAIAVTKKNIRSLRLSIHPPHGQVRISAPHTMESEKIRNFVESKIDWIRKHQLKIKSQSWTAPLQYVSGEHHSLFGKKYLLSVLVHKKPARVNLNGNTIELYIRSKSSKRKRQEIIDGWYRQQLKEIIPSYVKKYETIMSIHAEEWGVKKMKTKWGTCNITKKRIWLNLELAKMPMEFVEHVIVHELVHLLERKHNSRFKGLMDQYLPGWREMKEQLTIDS